MAKRKKAPEGLSGVLRDLLTAAGPSGHETAPARVFAEACSKAGAAEVNADTTGSTVARWAGKGDGPSLAIVGHADEIGLMVSHISDDGFLWFIPVGGWDPQILIGQRLEVIGRDGPVPGVVGKKPIHLLRGDERSKVPELRELHIDIGAKDGDEARTLVDVGDVAVIAGEPVELPNRRVVSRAMDNRLGCFIAYEAARLIHEAGGVDGDVYAVAVSQEEVGLHGARTTGYSLAPDYAIVVDVTHATDAPGIDEKELGSHKLGSGAAIARGTSINPVISAALVEAAKAEDIPYSIEATSGWTHTDLDGFFVSRGGVPCGLVSPPLRYMHSAVEMCQLDDVEACAQVIAACARRLPADVSFLR